MTERKATDCRFLRLAARFIYPRGLKIRLLLCCPLPPSDKTNNGGLALGRQRQRQHLVGRRTRGSRRLFELRLERRRGRAELRRLSLRRGGRQREHRRRRGRGQGRFGGVVVVVVRARGEERRAGAHRSHPQVASPELGEEELDVDDLPRRARHPERPRPGRDDSLRLRRASSSHDRGGGGCAGG